MIGEIEKILGDEAESLFSHQCKTISQDQLHLPGPDFIDRVFINTDRSTNVLRNLGS
jgi:class I fructose-bisphosphate aldolase